MKEPPLASVRGVQSDDGWVKFQRELCLIMHCQQPWFEKTRSIVFCLARVTQYYCLAAHTLNPKSDDAACTKTEEGKVRRAADNAPC